MSCDCHLFDHQVCDICQQKLHGNKRYWYDTKDPNKTMHEIKTTETASPLPKEATARKECPIASGVIDYFPDAIAAIAHVSWVGSQQHNPGAPLHWDRSKSTDEADALMRHFIDRGTIDGDGLRHSAKVAWRALALLQKEIEKEKNEQRA